MALVADAVVGFVAANLDWEVEPTIFAWDADGARRLVVGAGGTRAIDVAGRARAIEVAGRADVVVEWSGARRAIEVIGRAMDVAGRGAAVRLLLVVGLLRSSFVEAMDREEGRVVDDLVVVGVREAVVVVRTGGREDDPVGPCREDCLTAVDVPGADGGDGVREK